jgi:hypothetical protein
MGSLLRPGSWRSAANCPIVRTEPHRFVTSQLRDVRRGWNTGTGEVVASGELPVKSSQWAILVCIEYNDPVRSGSGTAIIRSGGRRQRADASQSRANGERHGQPGG